MALKRKTALAWAAIALLALGVFILKRGTPPESIIVAVIDTGLSLTDQGGKVRPGWNFYDNNHDVSDVSGHGTKVARAILEACGDCSILPLKISRQGGAVRVEDMASAFQYALKEGAKVINVSLGLANSSKALEKAVADATNAGTVVVAAAGMGVSNPFKPLPLSQVFPQSFSDVIVVGSLDKGGLPDATMNSGELLDLVVEPTSGVSGSSFAAAKVSGRLARFLKNHWRLTGGELRHRLRMATRTAAAVDLDRIGYGVFDPLLLEKGTPPKVGYRTYPSRQLVDFSAEASIRSIESRWQCKGVQDTVLPVLESQGSMKKGRARLVVANAPAANCSLNVRVVLNKGKAQELKFGL